MEHAQIKPPKCFPEVGKVPEDWRTLPQWCGWKPEWDGHKYKKPPYSPTTGIKIGAVPEYSEHFLAFESALTGAARLELNGVGFVFLEEDPYVGIDFDNCRNPETGEIDPVVLQWLKFLPSYTEVSLSKTGLHIIIRARLDHAVIGVQVPKAAEHVTIEIYGSRRFFVFTGNWYGDFHTITNGQTGLDKILSWLPVEKKKKEKKSAPISKLTALRILEEKLEHFCSLKRPEDSQNATLNACAFFAAKCFAAGILNRTEQEMKDTLRAIAKSTPYCPGIEATLASGWNSGLEEPLEIRKGEVIVTGPGHVEPMVKASEAVLEQIGLKYFQRNSELVNTCYARDAARVEGIKRSEDSVIIIPASHETILRDLDQRATYVTMSNTDGEWKESRVSVPACAPYQIHDRVHAEPRNVPFPALDMVTSSPVLLPSGAAHTSIFQEGVLFPNHQMFPHSNNKVTKEDAIRALKLFEPLFEKFPFVDPDRTKGLKSASYAAVLAGILSIVARPYFGLDAIPLIGVRAPAARSGKTKIVEASCGAMLGHKPTAVHYVSEDEFGKHLQPLMRAADRAILIDNVERTLQSAKLNILITGGILRDRILGKSQDVALDNYAVFFATGNNLVIGGDLASRALRIDIDAGVERPEYRKFDFDPAQRAIEQHPKLVLAAVSALQAYILAGKPWGLERGTWGGFERWDKLISGCLTWLGYADPCMTRDRIIEVDPVRAAHSSLLYAWNEEYGNAPTSFEDIQKHRGAVYDALLDKGQWNGHHAAWIMSRVEDRICDGMQLVRYRQYKKAHWILIGEAPKPEIPF